MALAQVGARLIDGLMSVVFFLTPAQATPAASAHASVIPLIALFPIIFTPYRFWVAGLAVSGPTSCGARQGPREGEAEREAGGEKREGGSGRREAGGGKRDAGGGTREAG